MRRPGSIAEPQPGAAAGINCRPPLRGGARMNARSRLVLTGLALGLGVGVVPARSEDPGAHARQTPHTVILDNQDVRPSTTTMGAGDTLVFENYSVHPVRITFTEPADLKERIRCGLVKQKEAEKARAPPQQLFAWSDGKLVGTIPPRTLRERLLVPRGPLHLRDRAAWRG